MEILEKEMEEEISTNDIDHIYLGKKHYGRIIDLSSVNLLAILKGKTVTLTENLTKMIITEIKITGETQVLKMSGQKTLFTDANDRNKIKVFYD